MHEKNCRNCQKPFTVYDEDLRFYEKMGVSEPTLCPECRQQRRLSWRPNLAFFQRQCDLCHKSIITQHPPSVPFPVYCPDCWWGDSWDRHQNGRDYDFSQSFSPQFIEVMNTTPRLSVFCLTCVNCDYADKTAGSKNCYLIIGSQDSEDCYYGEKFLKAKDCVDCNTLVSSELCYFCLDSDNLYNCNFCQLCSNSQNCNFCFDCRNCNDCFGCYNLRNKQFCFWNQQYTEDVYQQKLAELDISSWQKLSAAQKEFYQLMPGRVIGRFTQMNKSDNCIGDYLIRCDHCFNSFNDVEFKDCRYASDDEKGTEMMDTNNCGYGELCYEIQDAYGNRSCRFCNVLVENSFCDYCVQTTSCHDCFGCAGLNKAEFCILNKKYSEEDYKILRDKVIEQMKKDKEWGEFFSISSSPYPYNQSKASLFYPLTKDEILAHGWRWQEEQEKLISGTSALVLPDRISKVGPDILNQILTCDRCGKNYKLIKQELAFYQKKGLPVPRQCFRCRYFELFNLRNPRHLYHRECMCENTEHGHKGRCQIEFETTYSPDRPERVYCEECYRKEIY